MLRILVTGGAGFIGSCFVRHSLQKKNNVAQIINLDKLTYAGNLDNLLPIADDDRYQFVHGDIGTGDVVADILAKNNIDTVVHFAAESHVDRSLLAPDDFIRTNIVGTHILLQSCYGYWQKLPDDKKSSFRFLHISTDEVFGSLAVGDKAFDETTPYHPNSPYAASKAGGDHLLRSYHHSYGFPMVIAHCSNNYGPYQFPEKLIPLTITHALMGKKIPVYGDGKNIRDWLLVDDHISALWLLLEKGRVGQNYCIGGESEMENLAVVKKITGLLDELHPRTESYEKLIDFVPDRLGHDLRYSTNITKIKNELGFMPSVDFDDGLKQTIEWYLANETWLDRIATGAYKQSS